MIKVNGPQIDLEGTGLELCIDLATVTNAIFTNLSSMFGEVIARNMVRDMVEAAFLSPEEMVRRTAEMKKKHEDSEEEVDKTINEVMEKIIKEVGYKYG